MCSGAKLHWGITGRSQLLQACVSGLGVGTRTSWRPPAVSPVRGRPRAHRLAKIARIEQSWPSSHLPTAHGETRWMWEGAYRKKKRHPDPRPTSRYVRGSRLTRWQPMASTSIALTPLLELYYTLPKDCTQYRKWRQYINY